MLHNLFSGSARSRRDRNKMRHQLADLLSTAQARSAHEDNRKPATRPPKPEDNPPFYPGQAVRIKLSGRVATVASVRFRQVKLRGIGGHFNPVTLEPLEE